MHGASDQLKCSLILKDTKTQKTAYELSYLDNEPIDIGQEEWKYKMPVGHKTWKFLSHTPDMQRISMQRRAFQTAFNSLEKITKFDIDYEKRNVKTDFTVDWLTDLSVFGGRLSVLAHAYFFMPNGRKNGVIEFNDSPESKWYFTPLGWPVEAYLVDNVHFTKGQKDSSGNLIMRGSQPATEIGMHELGHSVGLRHDLLDKLALMYPYVKPGYIRNKINKNAFIWQKSDMQRFQHYFGKGKYSLRQIDRWRARRVLRHIYER